MPLQARPATGRRLASLFLVAVVASTCFQNRTTAPVDASSVPGGVSPSSVLRAVAAASHIKALPDNLTPSLRAASQDYGGYVAVRRDCSPADNQSSVGACQWGDPRGSRTLVLLGDSHAQMWVTAFDAIGRRLHWKVVLLAKPSCPPPFTHFYDVITKSLYRACDAWHAYTAARIKRARPSLVVMASDNLFPLNGDAKVMSRSVWGHGLRKSIRMIATARTRVVLMGDVPRLGARPYVVSGPDCLAAHEDNVQACSYSPTNVSRDLYNSTEKQVARTAGVRYIDVFPWFCSSVCTAVVGNMVVYMNPGHITTTYATYLSGALQAALKPAMTRARG